METNSRTVLDDQELHPAFTVSAARAQLPSLVQGVDEHPNLVVTLTRRHHPAALLVSQRQYGPVIAGVESDQLKPTLALIVTKKWLGSNDAPTHIFEPQIAELMKLEEEQLLKLRKLGPGLSSDELSKAVGLDKTVIERLAKRRKICLAIAQAQQENLYEVSEHLSGSKKP